MVKTQKYCLDANVLIQAWEKYYSPKRCPEYWSTLNELGSRGIVLLPSMVHEEIVRTDSELAEWVKGSKIPVLTMTTAVTLALSSIYTTNEQHKYLVDNTKQRSLADPWLIAHALVESACVVTKEERLTAINSNRIKIPNVCDNMGVRCINDFEFIDELGFRFTCTVDSSTLPPHRFNLTATTDLFGNTNENE